MTTRASRSAVPRRGTRNPGLRAPAIAVRPAAVVALAGVAEAGAIVRVAEPAHRWTVGDGKLTSFLMYTDTAKVLEALQP